MLKSRSSLTLLVSFALAFLVLSTVGVIPPSTVALAEGNDPGGCDADTCPPDTSEPGFNMGPSEEELVVMTILLKWFWL